MKIKNKIIVSSRLILFFQMISIFFVIISLANIEKLGKNIGIFPWIFLFPIIFSITGIGISLVMDLKDVDESIEDTGHLGPKPKIFFSARRQLLVYSVLTFIFSTIGFVFFMSVIYNPS